MRCTDRGASIMHSNQLIQLEHIASSQHTIRHKSSTAHHNSYLRLTIRFWSNYCRLSVLVTSAGVVYRRYRELVVANSFFMHMAHGPTIKKVISINQIKPIITVGKSQKVLQYYFLFSLLRES